MSSSSKPFPIDFSTRRASFIGAALAPVRLPQMDEGEEKTPHLSDDQPSSQDPARLELRHDSRESGSFRTSAKFLNFWRTGARLTRTELALVLGAMLLLIAAWPMALVDAPPFQDLPNHMAAVHILRHLERYPEFVSNGFFKTNSALFAWLYFVGQVVGIRIAARIFTLLVLGITAFAIPTFFLAFTNRRRAVIATLFAFPMVHNYFVSMGMLDFALGVPLSLLLLVALHKQQRHATPERALAIAALGVVTWYAHVFAVMVVGLLVALQLFKHKAQFAENLKRFGLPLLPAAALTAWSFFRHLTEPTGAMTGFVAHEQSTAPWELAYNFFAEWVYGFTWFSFPAALALVGAVWGFVRFRERIEFFSPLALATLLILYALTPYTATNWFHVNSRFIPYLWFGLLLRVPDTLPRWLTRTLLIAAPLYSIGLGVDYIRLDRDRAEFADGIAHVPDGAALLPLLFTQQGKSENTRSLLHAWGYYVTEKNTSAPLLFAHSRAFPVMYSTPPPPRFNHLVLEHFAPSMRTAEQFCAGERERGVVFDDCAGEYASRWSAFWNEALPRYDHVLLWEPTQEALAQVPSNYETTWSHGKLRILARKRSADVANR